MFNPPHIGHLVCAQEAHAQLGLDAVLFMPVAVPPHKEATDDPGAGHRFELCRLAVRDDERFAVSPLEIERGGPGCLTPFTIGPFVASHEIVA